MPAIGGAKGAALRAFGEPAARSSSRPMTNGPGNFGAVNGLEFRRGSALRQRPECETCRISLQRRSDLAVHHGQPSELKRIFTYGTKGALML